MPQLWNFSSAISPYRFAVSSTWNTSSSILDPARQEGKLVEKAVQVDLIVDVGEIGFAVDNGKSCFS